MKKAERILAMSGNAYQQGHLRMIERMLRLLVKSGFSLHIHTDFLDYLLTTGITMPEVERADEIPRDAFAALSMGGDGTFLQTAAWVKESGIPIIGINTGHLGYLSAFRLDDMDTVVNMLTSGNLRVEHRSVLKLECDSLPEGFYPYALNDVSILKQESAQMISVRSSLDNRYLADYDCDGLILSTATGSTAYNLSAGGPLLQPCLENIVISPVAPHSLTMRPLVVGGSNVISAVTDSRSGCYRVSVDGRSFTLPTGTTVRISTAPYKVTVLLHPDGSFAETLRNKLNWARR